MILLPPIRRAWWQIIPTAIITSHLILWNVPSVTVHHERILVVKWWSCQFIAVWKFKGFINLKYLIICTLKIVTHSRQLWWKMPVQICINGFSANEKRRDVNHRERIINECNKVLFNPPWLLFYYLFYLILFCADCKTLPIWKTIKRGETPEKLGIKSPWPHNLIFNFV